MEFSRKFIEYLNQFNIDISILNSNLDEVKTKLDNISPLAKSYLLGDDFRPFLQYVEKKSAVAYTKKHDGGAIFFAEKYVIKSARNAYGGFYFGSEGNLKLEFSLKNLSSDEKIRIPEHIKGIGYMYPLITNKADIDIVNECLSEWLDIKEGASSKSNHAKVNNIIKNKKVSFMPLNQILYGPPGTGKTFHTIEAAVKAAEPTFYLDLNIDQLKGATQEQRAQLQSKFKELSDSKRIRFVTFHQSYGYEEFVEGLKAECNDEGQISYCVEAGIFKQICQDAKSSNAEHQQFDSALEKLKELCSDEQNPLRVKTSNKSEFDVVYRGGKTFLLDPVSAGKSCGYSASLENIKKLYLTGNKDGMYNISYVRGLLEYMREHLNLAPISQHEKQIQPYVLVIDEINRGNISKIFGELITLIEPSKRKGAEEALEVTLPYSGDIFSVPDNLHIIGTMNTADRSLAMMDTALRRRFDFVEMMPKPELFKNRKIRNIDLTKLLTTLNNRIEVLYDREHTLGHAFLFPVYNEQDEDKAFELLKAAFKNKIIPLLEEYFFDDWNKIRLVLGDNQKEAALCFVTKQEDSYESLFGTNHGLNLYEDTKVTFQLASFDGDDSVWDQPEAYIAIYTKG
ncbi:TPA: McrB family protein [Photobacterium damselae]